MALTQRITDQGGPIPSGDAVAGLVPDGGLILESSGRVVAISPGAVSMLGRSITGLSEVLQDDDDFPRARVLEALLRANDAWAQTTQLVTLERQQRHYVLVRTEVVKHGPAAGLMLAIIADLTEILRQSDLAGDFIRQVRHDLSGPLTSLRGAVDLLASERLGGLEERQRKLVDLMDRAAQQLVDMLAVRPLETSQDPRGIP
jgi:Signal transduction histidine kinase